MGIVDRDYMAKREARNGGSGTYFSPPEPSATLTLWMIFLFAGLAYAGYKGWHQWNAAQHAAPDARPASSSNSSSSIAPATIAGSPRIVVTAPSLQRSAPSGGGVVKCVGNGATTYTASQADCATHAKATFVPIDPRQNLSDGLANAADVIRSPSPQTQPQIQVQETAVDPNVQKKALCQAYEEEIKAIDIRARQPLSAQEQDLLTARRRNARDHQFRLRC